MKSKKMSALMQMLFTYLAISKILYWIDIVATLEHGDLGAAGMALVSRILERDLPIILCVVAFYFLDKRISLKQSKYSNILENVVFYAVGYVVIMGISLLYIWLLEFVSNMEVYSWLGIFVNLSGVYLVVITVLHIKYYMKNKEKGRD